MQHPTLLTPSYAQALGHDAVDKRIDILRQIGVSGSISEAARAVGVSYKAAWQALDTLSNLAGVALVHRAVGGVGGGGAQLTEAGQALLLAHEQVQQARAQVLAQWQGQAPGMPVPRWGLRTSMRNQWPCTVHHWQVQGPLVQVHLQGALQIQASITLESMELLGLAPGMSLLALCKATAVCVHTGAPPEVGAVNAWPGRACRVASGYVGDEVAVELDAGVQMVGLAPASGSVQVGDRVWLEVGPSSIVLAVTD